MKNQQDGESRPRLSERVPHLSKGNRNGKAARQSDPRPDAGEQIQAADLTLVPGVMDTWQYGWRWGDNAHRESVTAAFQSTGADFDLDVTGYDMDAGDEISVWLNGNRIGFLAKGPNNAFNAGDTFSIPATMQQPGQNRIEFRQRTPGWIWGVTALLLRDAAPPDPADLTLVAGVMALGGWALFIWAFETRFPRGWFEETMRAAMAGA